MYISIFKPNKPTTPPDFSCLSPLVWQQSPKCQLFGQIITSKITLIYRQFLIQIICSKMKSLYLQQTSRSDLGIWLEVFLSTLSEGYTSAILSDPVLRISRCLVYARREFWVIQPLRERRTPALLFHSFFYECGATQYHQQNFESIEYFTTPNTPKLPWYFY